MGCICSVEYEITLDNEWVDEVIAEEIKSIPEDIKKNIIRFTCSAANCQNEWPVPDTDKTLTKQSTQKQIEEAALWSATGDRARKAIEKRVWSKIESKIDEQMDETFSDERKHDIKHDMKHQCAIWIINANYEFMKKFDFTTLNQIEIDTENIKSNTEEYNIDADITEDSETEIISSIPDEEIKKRQQLQNQAFRTMLARRKPLSINKVFKAYATRADKNKIDINGMTQFFSYFGLILTKDMALWIFDQFYSENKKEIEFDQFDATFTMTFNDRKNERHLRWLFEIFDIKGIDRLTVNDLSNILLVQNSIAVADSEDNGWHDQVPIYTKEQTVKLATKMVAKLGKLGKDNKKPIDKIYISCDEFYAMMKSLTKENMEVENIEKDLQDELEEELEKKMIKNRMHLQFIIPNSSTNNKDDQDEKKGTTIENIPKIETTFATYEPDSDIEITVRLTCVGHKEISNSKIMVSASYIDYYIMDHMFKAIEKYLNNKYCPVFFTVVEMCDDASSEFVPRSDIAKNAITKYDLDLIKQNGLWLKLSRIYVVEVYNQTIDCPKMMDLDTTDPLQCDIYNKMLKENEFSVENLRHLENDIHFEDPNSEKPQCKYGDECKTFIRMEENKNGKNSVEDECHMILYRHPPRTRTIKMSENINSLVLKTNSKECEPIYDPKNHHDIYDDSEVDYTASLLSEVIQNGYRFDLCLECGKDEECKHGYLCLKCGKKDKCDHSKFGIFEIVKQKMNSKRYKQLNLNFRVGHMLALVLYTGCECNYDLCKSQRNGDYKKWKWFDYF
eukprot:533595_1